MRLAVLGLVLLAGCDNPCQVLCVRMAEYSEDECGNPITDGEVDACVDAFADAAPEDRETCRNYTGPEVIAREWTCEDVNLYR